MANKTTDEKIDHLALVLAVERLEVEVGDLRGRVTRLEEKVGVTGPNA
ncbi:hypothetical protein HY504_00575 [Candidatus Wolfebacteria bacterium]|nr:hypothetical protein [Candidatus Wolfebacteria bacterium]